MNLRQKCKKLKQENERLKKLTVPVFQKSPCQFTTLVTKSVVTNNVPIDILTESMVRDFDDNTEILTAKQLAEKMGLSVSTVLRDCRRGVHPGAQKVDGKWLIPYSGLVEGV